jgi:uncharacterized damage-inducible protein DinB
VNPYASHLGTDDPKQVIARTASKLTAVVQILGTAGFSRSLGPGKWNAGSILCHLADTELAFAFRLRQAQAESHHVIQPFDQEAWAKVYDSLDPQQALQVFSVVRSWNVALLDHVPADSFSKPLTHPERGLQTLQTLVETMAGHDLNHLKQLEAIAAQTATAARS